MIRLGFGAMVEPDEEKLRFAAQLGAEAIIVHANMGATTFWDLQALVRMRTRIAAAGMTFEAIENFPDPFMTKIRLGAPGRDEQIERIMGIIRDVGRAGIPIIGYHFMLLGVWRTEYSPTGRGGALVSKYDHGLVNRAPIVDVGGLDEEGLWANLSYFLKAVVPVAEEEGVMLALHPDDPPVLSIAGTPRIIRSLQAYRRVLGIIESPANGLEFCQGTVSEMEHTPDEIYAAIREFAGRKKIAYVHFRNVRGMVPSFEETHIDDGRIDMLEAMRAYHEAGFKGVLIPDHVPGSPDDSPWGHRGRAFAFGYMKALRKCVEGR
jgi:mannonate dehydratase